jgi:hypothetical protein
MPVLLSLSLLIAQGWVGEGKVCQDTLYNQGEDASMCLDRQGTLMLVWSGVGPGYNMAYSTWLGQRWDEKKGVPLGGEFPDGLSLDGQGRLWLRYDDWVAGESGFAATSCWLDTAWGPEALVTHTDSASYSIEGSIACGGGQVWCCVDGQPTIDGLFSVWASRWSDSNQSWSPLMRVSPADGRNHWISKIEVDSEGTPLVVWNCMEAYCIYYSRYDGSQWTAPVMVNNPSKSTAAPEAFPFLATDRNDNVYLSYTGAWNGAAHSTVFYSVYNGDSWSEPTSAMNTDTNHYVTVTSVAADRPDDVWVAWDREGEGTDEYRVYASHFDGTGWSSAARLSDSSMSQDNMAPKLCLDTAGDPFAVWGGYRLGEGSGPDIYYNHFVGAVAVGSESNLTPGRLTLNIKRAASGGFGIFYSAPTTSQVSLDFYDQLGRLVRTLVNGTENAGNHSAVWNGKMRDGRKAASGVYFCRLVAGTEERTCKLVLLDY